MSTMEFDGGGIGIILNDRHDIPVGNQASLDEFALVEEEQTALRKGVICYFSIQDYLCCHFEIQAENLNFSTAEDI